MPCYSLGISAPLDLNTRTCAVGVLPMPTRSALPVAALKIATLDWWIGMAFSTMPPVVPLHGVRLGVLLDQVDTFHDNVESSLRRETMRLPLSRPVSTITSSQNLVHGAIPLENFRGQRHDLHELSVRSSRVTGPKMRVPMKRHSARRHCRRTSGEPSARRMPLAVRTTTAL